MGHHKLITMLIHFLLPVAVLLGQQPDTLLLQEVEVSGQRLENPQGSIPVQNLDAIKLQRIAGNSVADALRHFSGLVVKDYGGIGGLKTVQVRSLGAQHTGVFVDGIPLTDAATGQIDLGRLLIDLTNDVSLTSGGSPDLFRPARWYAQASAIALQTITPDFNHQGAKTRASLRLGSFGLLQPSALIDLKTSTNSRSIIGVRYLKADGTYPFRLQNGQQTAEWMPRNNSDVEQMGLHAKILRKTPKAIADYGIMLDHNTRGLPGAVTLYNPQASQRLGNTDLSQHIRFVTNGNKSRHQLLLRHALLHLNYLDPEFLNQQGRLEQNYLQQEYYLSQLWGYNHKDYCISVANDFTLNTLNAKHMMLNPLRMSWHQLVAASWQNPRWEINTHLLWMHAVELKQTSNNQKQYHPLSPGLSLAWRTNAHSSNKIRFMFKEAFRLPSFNDMYYNIIGNPSLLPEKAAMFNLGWVGKAEYWRTEWQWQMDVFHGSVRDKIIAIPTKNLFVWSMRNIGRVHTTGIELSLKANHQLNTHLFFNQQINYTLQLATDQTSAQSPSYGQQIQYTPRHAFNWFGMLSARNTWMSLGLYANSTRYFLPENIPANSLPAWFTLDLALGHELHLLRLPASLKAELNNLFNYQYEIIRSFPMPGRSFNLTLQLNIG